MYVRIKLSDEPDLPSCFLYEVNESFDVSRIVEVEKDGRLFWDSVDAYQEPSQMIGINSLIEGKFEKKEMWPKTDDCYYEEITADEFCGWFEKAVKKGKRRTHDL